MKSFLGSPTRAVHVSENQLKDPIRDGVNRQQALSYDDVPSGATGGEDVLETIGSGAMEIEHKRLGKGKRSDHDRIYTGQDDLMIVTKPTLDLAIRPVLQPAQVILGDHSSFETGDLSFNGERQVSSGPLRH